MVNIAEILKNAPKRIRLYSPIFGKVDFVGYDEKETQFPLIVRDSNCVMQSFDEFGRYSNIGDCCLFPSKECQTWDGWQKVIMPSSVCVGSVIVNNDYNTHYHLLTVGKVWLVTSTLPVAPCEIYEFNFFNPELRFATPEETEECFKELDRQGYKFENGEVVVKNENETEHTEKSFNKHEYDWIVMLDDCSFPYYPGGVHKLHKGDVVFTKQSFQEGPEYQRVFDGCGNWYVVEKNQFKPWSIDDAKVGDILKSEGGTIFIFGGTIGAIRPAFVAVSQDNTYLPRKLTNFSFCEYIPKGECIPATEEEKAMLFKRLERLGYVWNPYTLCIETKTLITKKDIHDRFDKFDGNISKYEASEILTISVPLIKKFYNISGEYGWNDGFDWNEYNPNSSYDLRFVRFDKLKNALVFRHSIKYPCGELNSYLIEIPLWWYEEDAHLAYRKECKEKYVRHLTKVIKEKKDEIIELEKEFELNS